MQINNAKIRLFYLFVIHVLAIVGLEVGLPVRAFIINIHRPFFFLLPVIILLCLALAIIRIGCGPGFGPAK